MELQLRSVLTPGPRRPPGCSDGGGSDWISALPDEMLLQILVRLRCARAAALTSALSRRWRGLWRHLPELSFREIRPDALAAALDQVACPALSLLEIDIPERYTIMDPARVLALLRAAAGLAPADLVFRVWGHCKGGDVPIEIPCFERATSVNLGLENLYLTPPAGGVEFPVLERLWVAGCRFDMVEMIQRCPRLRVLEVFRSWGFDMKVHSPTIEDLFVESFESLGSIDIMAPVLKKFTLWAEAHEDCSVSFSAPMAEDISWDCSYRFGDVGIGEIWRLRKLNLRREEKICILKLDVYASDFMPDADQNFSQVIAPLPAFSVLKLVLLAKGHIFGAMVLNLLRICSTVQRLVIVTSQLWVEKACPANCPCDQPQNWRTETISLIALEEVEIEGFGGNDHEIDFLVLLFRCATLMKRLSVRLGPEVSPGDGGCKKIYSILKANPDVKCSVYRSCGKQVMYA